MATSNLQNSYGPEMDHAGHDLPQAVAVNGLEPTHPSAAAAAAPPYSEQHAKNNQYAPPEATREPRKRRVLGLPVAAFWGIIVGLVLILAVALGVGLGVGLSQRGGSSDSSAAEGSATTTTSAAADEASTTTPAPTSTVDATISATSTTSADSSSATARNVAICSQASLVESSCTNLTVPVNTCVNFPSSYRNTVSSVDTGGPICNFYTGVACSDDVWAANGSNYLIPAEYNDAFSSVACMFSQ